MVDRQFSPTGQNDGSHEAPDGLAIERIAGENAAGHIFGTPTGAGSATFTVFAWCVGTNVSGQTRSHPYTLTVR